MTRRTKVQMGAVEAHVTGLIEALRQIGEPEHLDLAGRLWRCQRQREERRAGLRDRVDRPCRSVACPRCRRSCGRRWRESAADLMQDADPDHTSSLTILLAQTGTLAAVRPVVDRLRDNLRALRDRRGRRDSRWRNVSVYGIVEIDLLEPYDVVLLPPQRQAAVGALPVIDRSDDLLCVPHLHAVVSHPGIPRAVIEAELRAAWPGERRVEMKALRSDDVEEETHGIVGYATKHTMENAYRDRVKLDVPMMVQARYWGWLHAYGAGIAPLRIKIQPMRPRRPDVEGADAVEPDVFKEIEPMPHLIGRW